MAGMSNAVELRETERRVLGNLPAYRTAADHRAAISEAIEYGTIASAKDWPKGRTLEDLTVRLAKDRHCKVQTTIGDQPFVEGILDELIGRGLVEQDGELYAMTEAGLDALTA